MQTAIDMRFVLVISGLVVGGSMLSGCSTVPVEGYLPDGRFCFRVSKRKVCTAIPVPSLEQEAKAKLFEVDPRRQIVWVVRNARFDAYDKVSVTVNGLQVDMLPHTVSRFAQIPGSYQMTAMHRLREVGKIAIEGKGGEQIFVEVNADIGFFFTRFSLRQLTDAEGRRMAMVSKLVFDQRTDTSP